MPNVEEQICFFLFFYCAFDFDIVLTTVDCLWCMIEGPFFFLNALWFSIDFLSTFRSSTSRVTNYSKLWQHLRKKQDIGDMFSWKKKKTFHSVKCMTKAHAHGAYCLFTQAWHVNCPSDCPITQSNYKHNHNHYNFLKCDW